MREEPTYEYLELDQLVSDVSRPVPRRRLGPRMAVALWVLRLSFLLLGAMVIYVFVSQLNG